MDAFFASVEQLTRPTLRDHPVLVGGTSGRGVVAGASYEARKFGAHSAMPMHQAIRLCKNRAIVVKPRGVVYKAASRRIFSVISDRAGVIEQLSIDEGFAEPQDISSPEDAKDWALSLQKEVEEQTGLPCSIGMASTKTDAKMASDLAKPHGVKVIEDRMAVFGPRPVADMWGIGRVAQSKLSEVGVHTIAQFAAMDPSDVRALLGNVGVDVQRMASGDDPRPVAPRAANKQISAEQTLPVDAQTYRDVLNILELTAKMAYRRLQKDGRAARTVTVKIRTTDFQIHTRSTTLMAPSDDFNQLYSAARTVVPRPAESGAVRLVGVGFSGLTEDRQEILFPELSVRSEPVFSSHAEEPAPVISQTWEPTQDVKHPKYGHGWVQGAGVGVVTVRFETRSSGSGRTHTFRVDDPELTAADPLDSLDWGELALPSQPTE